MNATNGNMTCLCAYRYNIDITDKNFKLPRRAFRDVRIFFSKRLEKWYNLHVIRLLLHKRSHDLRHKMGVYPDWPYNVTLNVLTNYFEAQKAYDDKFLYINTYYRRVINSLTSKVEMHLFPHFINYVEDAIVQKYKT